ncbi:MAG: NGG1p interacting factor NIF3 [Clostridia bacterium]|nr:NGG1p interacting factor NIF3 [Clostridia bacterium]MDH7573739.1 NGG1p interacting factor NIF3 [Clostridia bacterium]
MRLGEIYRLAVQLGMEADPRGREELDRWLQREKEEFDKLPEEEKADYDRERLTNPYGDTRILNGEAEAEVRSVLAGIDLEVGEVLLAHALRQQGKKIDLLLAHHPEGGALANLYRVMHLQEDVLYRLGVPINVAEALMAGRISEVRRNLLPVNHQRAVDAARLLGFAFLCVHTPADNLVTRYLNGFLAEKAPVTLGDLVKALKEIPEYKASSRLGAGPEIILGSEERRVGKIFVDMTGGTEGAKEIYERLSVAGVGTVVAMHLSEEHRKEAEKHHLNAVIAGHMASDALGMNLFLDHLEQRGVKVETCSGLPRVRR